MVEERGWQVLNNSDPIQASASIGAVRCKKGRGKTRGSRKVNNEKTLKEKCKTKKNINVNK